MMALPVIRSSIFAKSTQCLKQTRTLHLNNKLALNSTEDLKLQISPSKFEKIMLVYAKSYASVEEVPNRVSWTQIRQAKDKMRVRVAATMVGLTFLGSYIMIRQGRQMRLDGDSLAKRGNEFIADAQEKGRLEREAKAASEKVA